MIEFALGLISGLLIAGFVLFFSPRGADLRLDFSRPDNVKARKYSSVRHVNEMEDIHGV